MVMDRGVRKGCLSARARQILQCKKTPGCRLPPGSGGEPARDVVLQGVRLGPAAVGDPAGDVPDRDQAPQRAVLRDGEVPAALLRDEYHRTTSGAPWSG